MSRKQVFTAISQISWNGSIPVPPEGWEIVLIDPGVDGNFSDLEIGEEVFAEDGKFLGFAWGDTESLLRIKEGDMP